MQLDIKKIKKDCRLTGQKINTIIEAVDRSCRPAANTAHDLPDPASTLEDLNDLVQNPNELVSYFFYTYNNSTLFF
jgi:hypothetical protein